MNLVLIGRFKEVRDAERAKNLIDRITARVVSEPDHYYRDLAPEDRRFRGEMLELLRDSELYSLGVAELEQFAYDFRVSLHGAELVVTTDEVDVSAFLKLLLEKGARLEVYSAHEYRETGYGR